MYIVFAPLLLASAFGTSVLASHSHNEEYHEALTLRPLRDGKLAARFAFTTQLLHTVPRTPESLDEDDVGTQVI